MENQPKFSDKHIDEINVDPENNFFTPIWNDIYESGIQVNEILDVGCGNGLFSIYAKKLFNCSLSGVDGNKYALQQAVKNGFDETYFTHNFDTEHFEFSDEKFDFIVCKDLLEHLLSPEIIVKEMDRCLKQGGYILIHVPNHFPIIGRLRFLIKNDIDTFNYFPDSSRWNFPHIRFFTLKSLNELMAETGLFQVASFSKHFPVLPVGRLWPKRLKQYLADKDPDNFSEGLTFLYKKKDFK